MFRKYVRNIVLNLLTNMCSRYIIKQCKEHMFADNCFEENDGGVQDEHKKNILGRIEGN